MNVLIAACDNFRAGAVEQLQTHGRCLDIPVFERGYGNDAAEICKEAVHEAKAKKFDVVLIDTAGRMQDNEPLMKALAKLVCVNNPDVILFVGEALVGNDAIDQLSKFNKSLMDYGQQQNPRVIDGIILTKFDTVDEKGLLEIVIVFSWCSFKYGLYDRKTHCLCGSRAEVSTFGETECQHGGAHLDDII